ncbi:MULTISPECIES: RlmE family RNA methyltransferase [unclassified Saccharibacter]|uniref:RlmE family RNA methyltransferase n=1 Tax=unclassified Saccharibacter TaxID=2648722 RepID=UPI001328E4EC|nr:MULTISPECIES: RlmE family RNA methyltransferase [unclassified Saccharibacter]MXV36281.1 RlmE family RNA methyltransferase [Saccharibacter sp. EH611]MXV57141.1 RlmE family RNA methyltransferase [Saccharibacter sp. EH70]MXV66499.1 RlmE family RNA methyltransferase [Saccharibacter sp. EH60]
MSSSRKPPSSSTPPRVPGKPLRQSRTPGTRDPRDDAATSKTRRSQHVKLKKSRGRTPAQQRWLNRQLNDPYVAAARHQGWRSRAAFKLIEIDDRFQVIRPGSRVVDLGAAPGGWSQIAVKRQASAVVGVDLLPVDPVEGAEIIEGDFMDDAMPERLKTMLGGPADLVMSDMAPNTTGHAATDHIRIMGLAENALDFALQILAKDGAFIAKVFQGGSEKHMLDLMKRCFDTVRHVKPPASRKESSELYVVAQGFRGLPTDENP